MASTCDSSHRSTSNRPVHGDHQNPRVVVLTSKTLLFLGKGHSQHKNVPARLINIETQIKQIKNSSLLNVAKVVF